MKTTVTVTVDCANEAEAEKAKQILAGYEFQFAGLKRLDDKLKAKDYLVTVATRDFITAKK
jgi:hypothetical protein